MTKSTLKGRETLTPTKPSTDSRTHGFVDFYKRTRRPRETNRIIIIDFPDL